METIIEMLVTCTKMGGFVGGGGGEGWSGPTFILVFLKSFICSHLLSGIMHSIVLKNPLKLSLSSEALTFGHKCFQNCYRISTNMNFSTGVGEWRGELSPQFLWAPLSGFSAKFKN